MVEEGFRKWNESAEAWIAGVRRGDVNRERLLDAPMLELAGDVAGRDVLDVGCGEGRFCRMLAARDARAVGLEPTEDLLKEARRQHPGGSYVAGVGEELPFESESFDLAVSYLTLIDIAGYREAISEMTRVLRPGGRLLIANLQSYATTRPRPWVRDLPDNKPLFAVEEYFEERAVVVEWTGISILNWHRPFEDYMGALLSCGLILEEFREPRPSLEDVKAVPSMLDEYRVPIFHVMRWRKP